MKPHIRFTMLVTLLAIGLMGMVHTSFSKQEDCRFRYAAANIPIYTEPSEDAPLLAILENNQEGKLFEIRQRIGETPWLLIQVIIDDRFIEGWVQGDVSILSLTDCPYQIDESQSASQHTPTPNIPINRELLDNVTAVFATATAWAEENPSTLPEPLPGMVNVTLPVSADFHLNLPDTVHIKVYTEVDPSTLTRLEDWQWGYRQDRSGSTALVSVTFLFVPVIQEPSSGHEMVVQVKTAVAEGLEWLVENNLPMTFIPAFEDPDFRPVPVWLPTSVRTSDDATGGETD